MPDFCKAGLQDDAINPIAMAIQFFVSQLPGLVGVGFGDDPLRKQRNWTDQYECRGGNIRSIGKFTTKTNSKIDRQFRQHSFDGDLRALVLSGALASEPASGRERPELQIEDNMRSKSGR